MSNHLVESVAARLLAAVNSGDVAGVVSVWAEDGVMMPPHKPAVVGRAAIEQYFQSLFASRKLEFQFSDSVIDVDANRAIQRLRYAARITFLESGEFVEDRGKAVHVFRRDRGDWKLALDIWNSDL